MGIRVPVAVSRLCRERRVTLGWVGNVVVAATDLRHKLPLAYLRENLPVLHLQLLFQGGVKFPTGGTVRDRAHVYESADPVKLRDQRL